MNAAIYIRKSREDGEKVAHRLTVQREQLPAYATAQGWQTTIYDDGHASAARGKAEQLPERARLEADIRAGRIGVVLVIELSRLSRDESMQDYVAWLTLCADHGVRLATMSRILDPAEHSDWMLLLMEGGFSSVEMKVLTKRMKEGRDQAFSAGKWLGGSPPKPYVYDRNAGRLIVDQVLLEEMEQVWTLAEKMSAKAIAEQLGLPEIAVRRAISDDRLEFYQARRTDQQTGDQIACEWEPVMDASRAERIRMNRRSRRTNTTRRDAAGLLSALGVMRCGYCGRTVKSWNNSKTRLDGTRLDYYACVTKNRKGACPKSRMIGQTTIDEKIINNMLATLSNAEALKACWAEYVSAKRQETAGRDILDEIRIEEEKKRNLVGAIAAGVIERADARSEMDRIKGRLAELQEAISNATPENEPDWGAITMTRTDWEILTFTERRQVIRSVIDKIIVYNNYAIINYLFPRTLSGSTEARVNFSLIANRPIKGQSRSSKNIQR